MANFSIPELNVSPYRFEYHSHFNGILPVKGELVPVAAADDWKNAKQTEPLVAANQPLSLVGLFGLKDGKTDGDWKRRGTVSLFLKALKYMENDNPLLKLLKRLDGAQRYERGECAGENIYIAAVWLADRLDMRACRGMAATDPVLYAHVGGRLEQLQRGWSDQGEPAQADEIAKFLPMLEYFNAKIYSANKYTPFDDAYAVRSFAMDALKAGPDGGDHAARAILMTYMYLQAEGILNAQLALGLGGLDAHDAWASKYNDKFNTNYKLLAHTSAVYGSNADFNKDLQRIEARLFDPKLKNLVGIDLLGTENKVGGYLEYFKFIDGLLTKTVTVDGQQTSELAIRFGPAAGLPSLKLINHIHCGEGGGVAADNRSAIGYAMAYLRQPPGASFYRALSDYILVCLAAARSREQDNAAGTRGIQGAKPPTDEHVSGLFDELFRNDSLTVDGLQLRRYDSNSERTRQLVAYTGKRNMMAIDEALDSASSAAGKSYYQQLLDQNPLLAFRLGHAYYYRSYIAGRYPWLAFDTNLGSNAITGASGLFDSVESYRLNRGLRHLDGYIDTNLIQAISDLVMYSGKRALDAKQLQALMDMVKSSSDVEQMQKNAQAGIGKLLDDALAPIACGIEAGLPKQYFLALFNCLIGNSPSPALWFDALARTLALFVNWRSYLLGSDGQGVEHTDIRNESLRCVLLMTYELAPFGADAVGAAGGVANTVAIMAREIVDLVSSAYWTSTVGAPIVRDQVQGALRSVSVDGFKAPDSVVVIAPRQAAVAAARG